MKCFICGQENRPEANFCANCASSFDTGGNLKPRKPTPEPTVMEGSAQEVPVVDEPGPQRAATDSTVREHSTPKSGKGKKRTVCYTPEQLGVGSQPSSEPASATARGGPLRARLVGFLVSFTWDTSGQWFPVREGKNFVGVSEDCDTVIAQDPAMSGRHFSIHCRGERVVLVDEGSTNATCVNDEEVWHDKTEAKHGAVIRAGETLFQLVMVPPLVEGR